MPEEASPRITSPAFHAGPRKRLAALHGANAEAGEVVITLGIHTRHLGGLPADEGAASLETAPCDARDDAFGDAVL
jgi:hypothetical protein